MPCDLAATSCSGPRRASDKPPSSSSSPTSRIASTRAGPRFRERVLASRSADHRPSHGRPGAAEAQAASVRRGGLRRARGRSAAARALCPGEPAGRRRAQHPAVPRRDRAVPRACQRPAEPEPESRRPAGAAGRDRPCHSRSARERRRSAARGALRRRPAGREHRGDPAPEAERRALLSDPVRRRLAPSERPPRAPGRRERAAGIGEGSSPRSIRARDRRHPRLPAGDHAKSTKR